MCKVLTNMGAEVAGYSLNPPTNPSLFEIAEIEKDIKSYIGDIRDLKKLKAVLMNFSRKLYFILLPSQ